MYHKLLLFALLFSASVLSAQEATETPKTEETPANQEITNTEVTPVKHSNREQTLFRDAKLTGGFGGPIFTLGGAKGSNGFGNGGGGGLVFNQFFLGGFGMSEYLDAPVSGNQRPALAYGGLWMGYVFPTNKLAHLYTSLKLAGGAAGTADFSGEWEINDDFEDVVFVGIPEAGVEVNVTRWFRMSGSVGYRYVNGFSGWESLGKNDLNAPIYALTLRFGWF